MPTLTQNMVAEAGALLPELMTGFMEDEEGGDDPFAKALPLADRDAWKITWDQKESGYGLPPGWETYVWRGGNFSCDCNRGPIFLGEKRPCGDENIAILRMVPIGEPYPAPARR